MLIAEFETDPEWYNERGGYLPAGAPPRWARKTSIDLAWVASAYGERWGDVGYDVTVITMCGAGAAGIKLNIPYEKFMPLWMGAKG